MNVTTRSRILLIEDNEGDVDLLRLAFAEAGVRVELRVCSDGPSAIDTLQEYARTGTLPDLVVLDLNLPGCGGLEVLAELRRLPAFAKVPVVVLTTSSASSDRHACERAKVTDYMVKPDRFGELIEQARRIGDILNQG